MKILKFIFKALKMILLGVGVFLLGALLPGLDNDKKDDKVVYVILIVVGVIAFAAVAFAGAPVFVALLVIGYAVLYVISRVIRHFLVEEPAELDEISHRSKRYVKARTIGGKVKIAFWADGFYATHTNIEVWPLDGVRPNEVFVGLHWLNKDRTYGGHICDKKLSYVRSGCMREEFDIDGWFLSCMNDMPINISDELLVYPIVYFSPDGNWERATFTTSLQDAEDNGLVIGVLRNSRIEMLRVGKGAY